MDRLSHAVKHARQRLIADPIELRVVAARRVAKAFSVESKLHSKYKPFHVRGEWFELTEHAQHELILLLRGEPVPKD